MCLSIFVVIWGRSADLTLTASCLVPQDLAPEQAFLVPSPCSPAPNTCGTRHLHDTKNHPCCNGRGEKFVNRLYRAPTVQEIHTASVQIQPAQTLGSHSLPPHMVLIIALTDGSARVSTNMGRNSDTQTRPGLCWFPRGSSARLHLRSPSRSTTSTQALRGSNMTQPNQCLLPPPPTRSLFMGGATIATCNAYPTNFYPSSRLSPCAPTQTCTGFRVPVEPVWPRQCSPEPSHRQCNRASSM